MGKTCVKYKFIEIQGKTFILEHFVENILIGTLRHIFHLDE